MALLDVESYVHSIFAHEVADPPWYWQDDTPPPKVESVVSCAFLEQLFRTSGTLLGRYRDDQVAQGLGCIVSKCDNCPGECLVDSSLAVSLRVATVRACYHLFADTLAPRTGRCAALDTVCRGWWDMLPLPCYAPTPNDIPIVDAMFDTLGRILELPSDSCQESALWGLYIWSCCGHSSKSQSVAGSYFAVPRPKMLFERARRLGLLEEPRS